MTVATAKYLRRDPAEVEPWRETCGNIRCLVEEKDKAAAEVHHVEIDHAKLHYHARTDEFYYIIAGSGTMVLDDDEIELHPGVVVYVPRGVKHKASKGTEWQYGLFPRGETSLAGSFGLMADKRPATIEIGYWVHVAETGRGLARRASRALTNASLALDDITTVCILCDEANVRSASVPRALGFTLVRTETRAPEAPAESGRLMVWERTEPISDR